MHELFDLSGTVAVVTGASTGLGQGMSLALASAGADVMLVDYVPSEDTAVSVRKMGRKASVHVANLLDMEAVRSVVPAAVREFGHVDILVNNAGIIRRTPAIEFSEKDWDDVLALNAKTVFFLAQAAGRDMISRKRGKIINVASLLSFQGGIIVPSYTAAKSAVAGVTRALANEWAPLGINVNAIAPGYMATNNTQPLRADKGRADSILARIPAGRWGTPDDLKGTAIFLASKASDYVNGHVLVVDGGWLAR